MSKNTPSRSQPRRSWGELCCGCCACCKRRGCNCPPSACRGLQGEGSSTTGASQEEKFNKAAEHVKKLKAKPGDKDLLEIYALFKQATVGDADPDGKPGLLDFTGRAKWEAWNSKRGTSKTVAQAAYIMKVQELVSSIGLQ